MMTSVDIRSINRTTARRCGRRGAHKKSGGCFGYSHSRHRPGHDLDARVPVRRGARAGRIRAARVSADLSRSPAGSSTTRRASGPRRSRPRAPRWRAPALRRSDVAAIGITNQRETTIVWDRATGKPIHNAIVWQDRRTPRPARRSTRAGHEKLVSERTGLLLDPYFSATKIAWLLDNVRGRARGRRSRQARLRHGRHVSALAPHRRQGARDRRHQCGAHAAARYPHRDSGTRNCSSCSAFRPRCCREVRDSRERLRHDRCRICSAGRCASSASRATSRPRRSGRAASSPA